MPLKNKLAYLKKLSKTLLIISSLLIVSLYWLGVQQVLANPIKDTVPIVQKKLVYQTTAPTEDKFIISAARLVETHTYNCIGQVQEKAIYKANRHVYYKYTYNKDNLLVAIDCIDETGDLLMEWLYTYNNFCQKIEETHTIGTIQQVCVDYVYNEAGNLIYMQTYSSLKSTITHTHWHYTMTGKLTKKEIFDATQTLQTYIIFEEDEMRNIKVETAYNPHNKKGVYIKRRYNNVDSLLIESFYNEQGKLHKEKRCQYNHQGQRISTSIYTSTIAKSLPMQKQMFYYDMLGNISTEVLYLQGQNKPTHRLDFAYEYF